jgi:hypothetical protein
LGRRSDGLLLAVMVWGGSHPMNFVFTWGPQAAIPVLMFLIGAPPAANWPCTWRCHPDRQRSLNAFVMTETDDKLIASAASSGLSSQPVSG